MKKITQIIALVSISILMSCSKKSENLETSHNNLQTISLSTEGISVSDNGFLVFSTVDVYEESLGRLAQMTNDELVEWEAGLGYQSAYSFFEVANYEEDSVLPSIEGFNNSMFEDPLLVRIIDKNGMIQIGEDVFALHLNSGFLLHTKESNLDSELDNLISGEFNENKMNKFSGDWDNGLEKDRYATIFEFLETDPTGFYSSGGFTLISMVQKDKMIRDPNFTWPHIDPTNLSWYNFKVKTVYQKVGVYFSLVTEFKYQRKTLSVSLGGSIDKFTIKSLSTYR